jgi:myo-inositol 2-dehydrogenase / D-chiro-inositol 1-dehydrogenase
MTNPQSDPKAISNAASRRSFFKDSSLLIAGGAVGCGLAIAQSANAAGSDTLKIGLIGCGGRGTSALDQALNSSDAGVQLTAMCDVFESRMQSAYRSLKSKHAEKVEPRRFIGLDSYLELLATDVDVVFLATPPGFRPLHFERAIEAGKHVFMEKPVAVDSPGVRRVLATGKLAESKGLAVQVGLQRRHEARYQQSVAQIHRGAIGSPIYARAYWNAAGVWTRPRRKDQSELEYQLNNWYYFNWLSGDHITEQHVQNLDVINWVMQGHPVEAQGQGGREVRKGSTAGQIFDHHMVEFSYDNGAKLFSQCRQMPGCWSDIGEHVHGTDGYCDFSQAKIFDRSRRLIWQSEAREVSGKGWQQEQNDLFAALRRGERPNETEVGAYSTMTSIMGRMATYSGRVIRWDEAFNSTVSLANVDQLHSLQDLAPTLPNQDGEYEVAIPGKTHVL